MFADEERIIREQFLGSFQEIDILCQKLFSEYEGLLRKLPIKQEEPNTYCASILANANLKSFVSAYDRLSKGYLSDSEAIFKKAIETFLAEIYFFEHLEEAKLWMEGKKFSNRRAFAQALDKVQKEGQIFPTDYEEFFDDYIYRVFYGSSNDITHINFAPVYKESFSEDGKTIIIGPRFDEYFMKVSLNRIMMLCIFQLSYLESTFKVAVSDNSIYEEARKHILANSEEESE